MYIMNATKQILDYTTLQMLKNPHHYKEVLVFTILRMLQAVFGSHHLKNVKKSTPP